MKCLSLLLIAVAAYSASLSAEEETTESIFQSYCFTCHGTGWEDAPVVGDSFDWEERKEQGIDTLLKHTLDGLNSMPSKGGCVDCTDEQLKAVVEWMIE